MVRSTSTVKRVPSLMLSLGITKAIEVRLRQHAGNAGARWTVDECTLRQTVRLNDIEPPQFLTTVVHRIVRQHSISRIHELLAVWIAQPRWG